MSEILIALLLIVSVALVVTVLKKSHKKQKKKAQDQRSAYLHDIMAQSEIECSFQKHLIHQTVILDERSGKILVVNHQENNFSHSCYPLDFIKTLKVVNLKQTMKPDKDKKAEVITSQIGVEIIFAKPDKEIFLILYDHIEHNIFQMSDLEKEAWHLHETIAKAKNRRLINA